MQAGIWGELRVGKAFFHYPGANFDGSTCLTFLICSHGEKGKKETDKTKKMALIIVTVIITKITQWCHNYKILILEN